ncbi:Galactose mutarotase [Filimonas lacunae]|uniref:Galactose mutarotase n=1 Tax=Filimonas lacunae TaxID=477680 RepID=A0A173MND2_9BACT|nr:aldose 1-epimerase family protein [Filimonas lacunae]BAV09152.1 aldose epimerase family protein [Filimonas lacunae]SIS68047.1 Galactose mutarotase [Filimonas lacunae]
MLVLENELLKVAIATKGAELQSIVRKDNGIEYMWSGDAQYWGKKSPVLFPIVGGLKKNEYIYNLNTYPLSRHGFARDMEFTVTEQSAHSATFSLKNDEDTYKVYPFHFTFSIRYQLENDTVSVTYQVQNDGKENLLFSVGGHPAFAVPQVEGSSYEDYYLEFSETENAGRWPLSAEGLIESAPIPVLQNTNILPLTKSLFYGDALVFKQLQSKKVSLLSKTHAHGLHFTLEGFPFLGIWAAKDANFVCIEPWCGIADGVYASGNLLEKEGINNLSPKTTFTRTWSVTLF